MPPVLAQSHTVQTTETLSDTIKPYLELHQAQFPDRSHEYQAAVLYDQQQVEAAQEAAQAVIIPQTYAVPSNTAKALIYAAESGNNPAAINDSSGACGLGQALPCSKLPCLLSDYACQDNWFSAYAIGRYGSWEAAWVFWQQHRWW